MCLCGVCVGVNGVDVNVCECEWCGCVCGCVSSYCNPVNFFSSLRNRIIQKRINVRIEHVKHSRCREDFLNRVKANELKKRQAKEKGEKIVCKRLPKGPRSGHFVNAGGKEPDLVEPIPYEFVA